MFDATFHAGHLVGCASKCWMALQLMGGLDEINTFSLRPVIVATSMATAAEPKRGRKRCKRPAAADEASSMASPRSTPASPLSVSYHWELICDKLADTGEEVSCLGNTITDVVSETDDINDASKHFEHVRMRCDVIRLQITRQFV